MFLPPNRFLSIILSSFSIIGMLLPLWLLAVLQCFPIVFDGCEFS